MSEEQYNIFNNPKYLMLNILKMTIIIPLTIVFFTNMGGPGIGQAFISSFDLLTDPVTGSFFTGLIIFLNLAIYIYLKPVLCFHRNCTNKCVPGVQDRKKAIRRFNFLLIFFLLISIFGFTVGFIADFTFLQRDFLVIDVSLIYEVLNTVSIGLFCGILMYLNTENILFSVKKRVFEGECPEQQKYSSFYFKLILTVTAIVFFLIFQMLDSFSGFYHMGATELLRGYELEQMDIGKLFDMSRESKGLKDLVDILFLRILIYSVYVFHLFRQIKKMILNPLKTVDGKLKGLNSDNPELSKEIDIVNNDEFTGIYSEINKLIEKQNTKLQRSQEKLDNIVENAADPIVSFHRDGSIHVFNPAAELFFGYKKEEAFRSLMIDLIDVPEELREQCEKDNHQFIDYISNFETKLKRFTGIHKNGKKLNFESNVSISETDHGTLFTAILRDVSGQMEFEENLKKAKVSAENANKMKSEFLANMSHELRTPLNAVLGFTQLLSTDKNLTGGQHEKISTISRSGEHLLGLINDILDISKIESGKNEMHNGVFDLKMFVNDLKDMFVLRCQSKDLSFYVEYAGDVPLFVEGDLGKLRQIMINLIGNAVKFTSEGGISLIVGEDNGELRFSVNDTGKGIPANEIQKIIQPFMQSSNVDHEGGTGLGLAISNSFIRMMGGELQIRSEEGRGSSFSFSLPLKISDTAPAKEEDRGSVLSIKGGRVSKALIVDDKENNRLILKTMLEKVGFVTMEAVNGQQAIERTGEFDPEIIFMDIKMPIMDGYESVKRLKATEQGRGIKIFALTASAFRHDEKKIFESGFDGFLPKPFKMESLFRIISDKTDIEFLYETIEAGSDSPIPDLTDLDYQFLADSISEQELEDLADNVLINDFTAIKEFANQLGNRDGMSGLVTSIRHYADNFNDQKLENIIEEIKGRKK